MIKPTLSFTRVYTLIPQTPLIHFQYQQSGATLRATEVKPKLDAFLTKKAKKEGIDLSRYCVKDTKALDYKIRFRASGIQQTSNDCQAACRSVDRTATEGKIKIKNSGTINAMYFANMVSSKGKSSEQVKEDILANYKETVLYKEPIKMTVTCFIPELLNIISENIQSFFILHNFGTRQSKGFGGFIVSEKDGVKCDNDVHGFLKGYKYFYADCGSSDIKELMNHALTVYAILKGGLNMTSWKDTSRRYDAPDNYIKSYIQRPFLDEIYGVETGSEKAKIKSRKAISEYAVLSDERRRNDSKDKDYTNYVFIRAMLGLADHYEFRSLRNGNVNVYSLGETGFNIERFKSPITIKVIGESIYFVFDIENLSAMTNQTFYLLDNEPRWLDGKSYEEKKKYIMANGWKIKTPAEFGEETVDKLIKGFVKYFFKERCKLNTFKEPFKKSANLILREGK